MKPDNRGGPRKGRPDTTDQPATGYPDHETYMYGLAWRIRWLERHEHWWIRDVRRRHEDGEVAA